MLTSPSEGVYFFFLLHISLSLAFISNLAKPPKKKKKKELGYYLKVTPNKFYILSANNCTMLNTKDIRTFRISEHNVTTVEKTAA
jgi:hypothetical protein